MPAEPGDQELTADGVRALAVHAFTGLRAGCGQAETLGVGRCGYVTGTFHSAVQIAADLVHADDEEHLLRSLADGGDPVRVSVNIDEDTVVRHGVGTGEEYIRVISGQHGGTFVFVGVPIDKVVVSGFQGIHKADFMGAHGTAHGDGTAFRDQGKGQFQRILLRGGIVSAHVTGFETFNHFLCEEFITFDNVRIHTDLPVCLIFKSVLR